MIWPRKRKKGRNCLETILRGTVCGRENTMNISLAVITTDWF